MVFNKLGNVILVLTGSIVAIYAQAEEQQNIYFLVAGIVILMLGLYRVSKTIPSTKKEDENDNI